VLAAAVVAATTTSVCPGAHVRLVNEGVPGPLYECEATGCAPAQTDNPSRKNLGRMDFYVLPDGCVELGSAVLRPAGPGVDVECGPPGSRTRYRCEAGACPPLDPPAGDDDASSGPVQLPEDCGGRVHELIVLDASTDSPRVYVECDASSGPAGEM
jgi:hypothetical protein